MKPNFFIYYCFVNELTERLLNNACISVGAIKGNEIENRFYICWTEQLKMKNRFTCEQNGD